MSIKRISELDIISTQISDLVDDSGMFKPNSLSAFIFETSEWCGEINEANSYYISKRIDGNTLSTLMNHDTIQYVNNEINNIRTEVNNKIEEINTQITNLSNIIISMDEYVNKLKKIIEFSNWPQANISCTNLTCENDIRGCAMSARWC